MLYELGVLGANVVTPGGADRLDLGIVDGKFAKITKTIQPEECSRVIDGSGLVALPGVIDAHNHPYYDDDIVEFATAAAYGGITAMLSFAGTNIKQAPMVPQAAPDVVAEFVDRAGQLLPLDFGVHAIIGNSDDPESTVQKLLEMGVTSLKLFMAFPGKRMLDDATILRFMQAAARHNMVCMVHCENGHVTELLERQAIDRGRTRPLDYAASRPVGVEAEAIYRALTMAEIAGCSCYLVHVSSAQSLDVIREFRGRGNIQIWVETCPHYLLLTTEDLNRLGGLAKISPPLRKDADISALWMAIAANEVDVIASDCSGQLSTPKLVDNIFEAPYGVPGVEHMLPLIWHHTVNLHGLDPSVVANKMSRNPSRIFGLNSKGQISENFDADLVLVSPAVEWVIRASEQHGNSDYSLYEGWKVKGRPIHSLRRGQQLLRDGELLKTISPGEYISRETRSHGTVKIWK